MDGSVIIIIIDINQMLIMGQALLKGLEMY